MRAPVEVADRDLVRGRHRSVAEAVVPLRRLARVRRSQLKPQALVQEVRHRQQEVVVLVGVDPLVGRGVFRLEADEGGRLQAPHVGCHRGVETRDVGQETAPEAVVGATARERNDAELGLRAVGRRLRRALPVRGVRRQRHDRDRDDERDASP